MTFAYIIQKTANVAIRPLEYVGHAGVAKDTHGTKLYVVFYFTIKFEY
jgi:hypothetical protein